MAERLRRYVQVVVNFVGVGSSPTECSTFFVMSWSETQGLVMECTSLSLIREHVFSSGHIGFGLAALTTWPLWLNG